MNRPLNVAAEESSTTLYSKVNSTSRFKIIRAAHLLPCHDISATVTQALDQFGPQATLAVLPQGPLTIPYLG